MQFLLYYFGNIRNRADTRKLGKYNTIQIDLSLMNTKGDSIRW